MSRRLILILALVFVLGISFAAYAEVQNVKVSGDITPMGVYRNNFDLTKNIRGTATTPNATGTVFADKRDYFATITRVRVDADLTDNVSTTIRLLNEKAWNGDSATNSAGGNQNVYATPTPTASYMQETQIDLDLAYVHLKEFLYSPLSLTVGRQELHFGNDWLIGDPDTNGIAARSRLPDGDLSMRKSFDALRATLDYNPLVLDIIYAKITEGLESVNDDTTLTGLNAKYELNKNTTLEGFFFAKLKGSKAAAVTNVNGFTYTAAKEKGDRVFTLGGRVVDKTVKNLTVDAQAAYQFGTYDPRYDVNANQFAKITHRNAWGAEVGATYDLKGVKYIGKYDPAVTAVYVILSGDSRENGGNKSYKGWDPMFENQTFGSIINGIFGFSNAHLAGLSLKAKPVSDVTMKLDVVGMWTYKRYTDGRLYSLSGANGSRNFYMNKNPHYGNELDLTMTYDYTEDVQFSLLGGIFMPGKAIEGVSSIAAGGDSGHRASATELIGSMKVTF